MTLALHHSRAKGTAKVVLLGIANHVGDGGAWPSVSTLAQYANVDVRRAREALATLERLGEIRRDIQAGGTPQTRDHQRPNLYHFLLTCPPDCDRSANHRTPRTKTSGGDENVRGPRTETSAEPSVNQDMTKTSESSHVSYAARLETDAQPSTQFLERLAAQSGLLDVPAIVECVEQSTGLRISGDRAIGLGQWLLDKSKHTPRAPQRYVLSAIRRSPAEIDQHLLGGVV